MIDTAASTHVVPSKVGSGTEVHTCARHMPDTTTTSTGSSHRGAPRSTASAYQTVQPPKTTTTPQVRPGSRADSVTADVTLVTPTTSTRTSTENRSTNRMSSRSAEPAGEPLTSDLGGSSTRRTPRAARRHFLDENLPRRTPNATIGGRHP